MKPPRSQGGDEVIPEVEQARALLYRRLRAEAEAMLSDVPDDEWYIQKRAYGRRGAILTEDGEAIIRVGGDQ